jgi:hypothetical protein
MPTFTYKSVKSAINLPIAVGVAALVALAGSPAAAAASSAAVASPAGHMRIAPKPLTTGLIGEADLPAGYKTLWPALEDWIEMPGPNTDPCDMTTASATASATPPPAAHRTHYANLGFQKGDNTIFETLAVNGDKGARADVAVLTTMLRDCPVLTDGEGESLMTLKIFPAKLPSLGDASSAMRYVIEFGDPALILRGEVIAIAHHGISVGVTWDGQKDPNQAEMAKVATKALAKIKTYKP